MRDSTSRADHELTTAFISGVDARTMCPKQTRYETHHEPERSPGIARAARVLAQRKRAGVPFDWAWDDAVREVVASDRRVLTWARDRLRDAYENRSGGPLASAAVED